jgi:hypothetical protein
MWVDDGGVVAATTAHAPRARVAGSATALMRLALSALCLAQAWTIVFVVRIGPVVGVIDASAGRGVHSGDLLAAPLVGMAMALCGQAWMRESARGVHPAPSRPRRLTRAR